MFYSSLSIYWQIGILKKSKVFRIEKDYLIPNVVRIENSHNLLSYPDRKKYCNSLNKQVA